MTTERRVEVSAEEWENLQALKQTVAARKIKGKARSEARKEIIRRYKPEYDGLVKRFGAGSS